MKRHRQINTGARALHFDKQLIFSPRHITEINYNHGAHRCNPEGKRTRAINMPCRLWHYKYIGRDYLYQKHQKYHQRLSDFNKSLGFGAEYAKGKEFIDLCFDKLKEKATRII